MSFILLHCPWINNTDVCIWVCVSEIYFQYFVWSEKKRAVHKVGYEHSVLSSKCLIQTMNWHFSHIIGSRNHYQLLCIRMMSCSNASIIAFQTNIYTVLLTLPGNRWCTKLIFSVLMVEYSCKDEPRRLFWKSWFIVHY